MSRAASAIIVLCAAAFAAPVFAQGVVGGVLTPPPQARVAAPAAAPTVNPGEGAFADEELSDDPAVAQVAAAFGLSPTPTNSRLVETINQAKATTRSQALLAGDWRSAAFLGASAAEITRALQARGLYPEVNPDIAVVVITQDGAINSVYGLKPLPPLPGEAATKPVVLGGVAPPDAFVEGATPAPVAGFITLDVGFAGITLRPPYFGSDYGGGAPTPQIAAERLGMTL